jgi:hypothetical protein
VSAGLLFGGCALVSTPHRPYRLAAAPPRASVIETSVAALADPSVQAVVRHHSVEIHPEFTMAFVEFDDQGRFWNRDQLELVERTLESENARPGTSGIAVVIFAHGWRHNCDVCDSTVACFRAFLKQLHSDAVAALKVSGGRILPKRIVAVYVGWRGLSENVQPFEFLSFWARNNVARRIASGDFIELLTRTELFVRRANAADPDRARLSVLGHSLGGTMVYAALVNILKNRMLEASESRPRADAPGGLILGFGSLVVLVNPAFEASLYAPLDEIAARFRGFSPLQTPVLITVQSETDEPNSFWFPLGRHIETLFQSTGDRSSKRQVVTSAGNYKEFWTHRLTAGTSAPSPPRSDDPASSSRRCSCALPLAPIDEREAAHLVSVFLDPRSQEPTPAGTEVAYGRAVLKCLKPIDPRDPLWVVRASDDVVHGHNGFFPTYLTDFIRRVIVDSGARLRSSPG